MPFVGRQPSLQLVAAAIVLIAFLHGISVAESDAPGDTRLSAAQPRLQVAPGNATEIEIRDCLGRIVAATNAEDLDRFVDCFAGSLKARIRKPAAIRFVQHDVSMELVDAHVLQVGKSTCEVVVRYRLFLTEDRFDVVSLVAMKHDRGSWRIKSEKIQSYEHQSPGMCSPSRYACLGATCRVAGLRQ